jgi:Fe-S cluster assembly iron-binding protein IscA
MLLRQSGGAVGAACQGTSATSRSVMRRFDLGTGPTNDDYIVDCGGQKLVIDSVSHEFVKGATVDFADELIKSTFEVGPYIRQSMEDF